MFKNNRGRDAALLGSAPREPAASWRWDGAVIRPHRTGVMKPDHASQTFILYVSRYETLTKRETRKVPDLDEPFHLVPVQLAVAVLVVHLERPLESVLQVSP